MSGWPRHRPTPRLLRTRLSLEQLETRDCLAAPSLTFTAEILNQNFVELRGVVTDENPSTCIVQFSGLTNGSTSVEANGTYSKIIQVSEVGTVSARVTDNESLASDWVHDSISSNYPVIVDFSGEQQADDFWQFDGTVVDEQPAGLWVHLYSEVYGFDEWVQVQSDGSFSCGVQIQAGMPGTVIATVWDWFNQESYSESVQIWLYS